MSKSGYYARRNRPESAQSRNRGKLRQLIAEIFYVSKGRYGSPQVYQSLLRQGVRCSENTVAALIHESGLKARVYRVYKRNPKILRYFKWIQNLRLNGA